MEVGPLGRPQQLGDIPGPDLIGRGGQQFRLVVLRVPQLVSSLVQTPRSRARMRYIVRIEQRYGPDPASAA